MKELEKTKRISVAAVLTILIVAIAVLTYKRPKHNYTIDSKASLEQILKTDYLASIEAINSETDVLIDVRGIYDYNKGYLNNAVNMFGPEILNDENFEQIENFQEAGKNIIIYGANPNEALEPFMVLSQIGVKNLKMLPIALTYNQTQLVTKTVDLEKPNGDIAAFIAESIKKAKEAAKAKPVVRKAPPKKVVIPKKKKKKMPIEGGC
jgi:rhodanese-related sulfurtransferase